MNDNKYMNDNKKLLYIKTVHTVTWLVLVTAIFYILYAGIFDRINIFVWLCIGLITVEGIILLIFKGKCPFTVLGYKFTNNHKPGFDIFLPEWLSKNNKLIFTTLFTVGCILVFWRIL